jgi:uncharacterized YigZ family protein
MGALTRHNTVARSSQFELDPIKGSRFIATIVPVSTEAEAMDVVQAVRAQWSDARHHCWAFRLVTDERSRSSDDGEPGGSAGRPILAQIVGHDTHDVAVVVTRWFGGVKLGIGGLIRAYGGCAGKGLDATQIIEVRQMATVQIRHTYDDTSAVEVLVAQLGLSRGEAVYDEGVSLSLTLPVEDLGSFTDELANRTGGRATVSRSA